MNSNLNEISLAVFSADIIIIIIIIIIKAFYKL